MKYLKRYKKFIESIVVDLGMCSVDIMESMNVWYEALLSSIGAEEVDIFDAFKLPKDYYQEKMTLDFLADNVEFINSLSSVALKKSAVQSTEDYATFINKPCRFMFIYNIESNELENPVYICLQTWNESLNKWEDVKLYKINENIQRFYDKLTSKTIEITDGGEKYIYTTSNSNEWELQNAEENDTYKKVFRKEEFEKLLNDRKAKVNII
jgi:hypothetical protein